MADVLHRVIVEMVTGGGLSSGSFSGPAGQLAAMEGSANRLGGSLRAAGESLANSFTSAVESAGRIAVGLGTLGAGAAIGAAAYGVVKLNGELEKTKISLGSIFSANGLAGSMPEGMRLAGDIMTKIRADAKALPGETEDLVGIFRAIAIPGARTGADANRLEKLSANIMAAGSVAGLQMDMVARESAQLLAGRAGSHNVLGSTLFGLQGDSAEKFNAMGGGDRLKFLEQSMAKYEGSRDYFNNSFDAQTSTLADNVKNTLRMTTEPLFGAVKSDLVAINKWFDDNEAYVTSWSNYLGGALRDAWSWGSEEVQLWAPAIRSFVVDALRDLNGMWTRFGPMVGEVADKLRNALSNGDALAKVESILKAYAAIKAGGGILSGASSVSGMFGSMGGMGGGAGALLANPAGAAAAGVLAGALLALTGELYAYADASSQYHAEAVTAATGLSTQWDRLSANLNVNVMPALEYFGVKMTEMAGADLLVFNEAITTITHPTQRLALMFDVLAQKGENSWLYRKAQEALDPNLHGGIAGSTLTNDSLADIRARRDNAASSALVGGSALLDLGESVRDLAKPKSPTGGGGVTIAKVDINVSSNADPSRVARLVFNEVKQLSRNPGVSPDVANYSAVSR